MMIMLLNWAVLAGLIILTGQFVPGIFIEGWTSALIAALVMGLLNLTVKPILQLFTLPITILTLGLFTFLLNAFMFGLTAYFVPGFQVDGFFPSLIGSIVLGLLSGIILPFVEQLIQAKGKAA